MRFTVKKQVLLKELNLIQGVVEKKGTIPILSYVLLETKDDELWIRGTDFDLSMSTHCGAEIKREGSICLQAKKLFEIVRSLPEAEIEITRGDSEQVTIVCERSRFKMIGLTKDNFPEIPEFSGTAVPLLAETIRTFIQHTAFAITMDESRYTLSGAKFEMSEKGMLMVATDGYRLSFIQRATAFEGTKVDVLIPRKTLTELTRLCAETEDAVEFGHNENHLFFNFGKRLLTSRSLSGQFPNYEMVLPKENHNRVPVECGQLAAAIRRVALMADERSHAIKFEAAEGQVNITSQAADVGEAGDSLAVEYAGPAITAAFNAQYLLDFFGVVQEGEIWIEFKDGQSQALLRQKDAGDYDFRYVIMPMRP